MIKVGIYGPDAIDSPIRKQLLRLLLRHPDVDLRAVASPAGNTVPIADLHPVYAGETDLTLERVLALDSLDVLFVIDEENISDEMNRRLADADDKFAMIVIGQSPATIEAALSGDSPVYGLPEYYRKALVRGARYAVSPRPDAMITELALLPLAKAGLLAGRANVEISSADNLGVAAAEAQSLLRRVQPDSDIAVEYKPADEAPYERIDARITINTPLAIEEIERIYREAYDDHNFVYVIGGSGRVDEDLRGSNKCLLRLGKDGDTLVVDASMDALTKGCTGNAVHIMDLIFGLHERTGLSI